MAISFYPELWRALIVLFLREILVFFGKSLAAIVVVFGIVSGPVSAATLNFNFSFTNAQPGSKDELITGIVRGLVDNGTSKATSVEVLSNTAGYGLGEYLSASSSNRWVVASGAIIGFQFRSLGKDNAFPAVTDSSLTLFDYAICTRRCRSRSIGSGLTQSANNVQSSTNPVSFDLAPAAVPLPAGFLLLLSGLGAVVAFGRRRTRAV